MTIDDEKCLEYSLDTRRVASIARRLSRAATEAQALGLTIFGGSGSGSLRYNRLPIGGQQTEVARLDGRFDGGDGGDDGALRSLRNRCPVILLSHGLAFASALAAVRCGAYRYLLKPISDERLLEVLVETIQESSPRVQ